MSDTQITPEAVLEVIGPDGSRRMVRVNESPFLIGRGAETGNHLQLTDRRISRECAALVFANGEFRLEDRGQRRGLFVNGEKVGKRALREGDNITFGLADSYELIFHAGHGSETLPQLLTRMEHMTTQETGAGGLRKLSLLLEATALLHSHMPLDAVLGTMVDQTIALTDADRGLLFMPDPRAGMRIRLARQRGGRSLPLEGLVPSQTALRQALEQKRSVVTEDVAQADMDLQAAQSIISQRLRAVVVIPLYAMAQLPGEAPDTFAPGELLGVLYLDSRRPAAFSSLERQILDALAVEAASVIDNARLVERERERERMEQELSIARDIQQALLPREFQNWPHLQVTGINHSCLTVGGDYFDVLEIGPDRTAFIIADVSGKGLGAALLTTMLQGALSGMTIGQEPADVFAHVNRFLCDHSQLERYATMFFGILHTSGQFEFINAGHPSPMLIRGDHVESPFPAECFPVGLLPDAEFKSSTFTLRPGDTLVLFSDGVTEAKNPAEEEFGTGRLREVLAKRANAPVEELQTAILAAVKEFTRGASQADDITLLLIHFQEAAQTAKA
jgi:sigma-B regulation protein RsbU (phosphoserine phosphatase)